MCGCVLRVSVWLVLDIDFNIYKYFWEIVTKQHCEWEKNKNIITDTWTTWGKAITRQQLNDPLSDF